jgi:hypothetical protein
MQGSGLRDDGRKGPQDRKTARQCIMYYRRCENNWQLSMNN